MQELCDDLSIPLQVERQSVGELAAAAGDGLEETARKVRYEFLQRVAEQQRCSRIALAHTSDDQVETILHHVLRGTGLSGLSGMPATRDVGGGISIVRPLLAIERTTIETYLTEINQDFRIDATNRDLRFTRNRIRRTLLPLLESEFNPQVRAAVLRLGNQARQSHETIDDLAARLLDSGAVGQES